MRNKEEHRIYIVGCKGVCFLVFGYDGHDHYQSRIYASYLHTHQTRGSVRAECTKFVQSVQAVYKIFTDI